MDSIAHPPAFVPPPEVVSRNLATVDAHIQGEARDPASVLALYTPDVVLEVPGRGQLLSTHDAIEANYRALFAAMAEVEIEPLDRFATAERVVDECIVRFRITGEGIFNCPLPVGARAELRLLHVFRMQDGLISRETVYEGWRRVG